MSVCKKRDGASFQITRKTLQIWTKRIDVRLEAKLDVSNKRLEAMFKQLLTACALNTDTSPPELSKLVVAEGAKELSGMPSHVAVLEAPACVKVTVLPYDLDVLEEAVSPKTTNSLPFVFGVDPTSMSNNSAPSVTNYCPHEDAGRKRLEEEIGRGES